MYFCDSNAELLKYNFFGEAEHSRGDMQTFEHHVNVALIAYEALDKQESDVAKAV